jgi:hypothetical protein
MSHHHKHGHLKHGEKEVHTNSYTIGGDSRVIETIPQVTTTSVPIVESTTYPVTSTISAPIIESSTMPITSTTGTVIESSTIPLSSTTTIPQSTAYVGARQPEVRVYEKTTIEHHDNLKERAEAKVEKAKDKILGFIPNPFSHHHKEETERTKCATCSVEHPSERTQIIQGAQPSNIIGTSVPLVQTAGMTSTVLPGSSSFQQTTSHPIIQEGTRIIEPSTTKPLIQESGTRVIDQPLTGSNLPGLKGEIRYTNLEQKYGPSS